MSHKEHKPMIALKITLGA